MPDICLVSMPYNALEFPSISIGTLIASAKRAGLDARGVYAKFWFAEKVGLARYVALVKMGCANEILPEWTFSGTAFPETEFPGFCHDHEGFLDKMVNVKPGLLDFYPDFLGKDNDIRQILVDARNIANEFIDEAAQRVLDLNPRIVGCSSTFQQNCASLALLRKIKELDPAIVTMMGGANCEGALGRAVKRCFNWVDYVVSGEADELLPGLCCSLLENRGELDVKNLPFGVISSKNCDISENNSEPYTELVVDMDKTPYPDFDDYFKELETFKFKDNVFPILLMETSRGCWWGEKNICSFCSLNGERESYRAKSDKRALGEMEFLSNRYAITNFRMVDNVLSKGYFETLLPALSSRNDSPPYRFFYEVKPDLDRRQVEALSSAGIRWIQLGIESLHDKALKLLHKGGAAINNVAQLKYSMENGINASWSILCGMPAGLDEWNIEMAAWLPLIYHLQPPLGIGMFNIRFHRFSWYFNNWEEFALELKTNWAYSSIYPLSDKDMRDIAYFFEDDKYTRDEQFKGKGAQLLNELIKEWQGMMQWYSDKEKRINLSVTEEDNLSRIEDTRPCAVEKSTVLTGTEHLVYKTCRQPRRINELATTIQNETGLSISAKELDKAINYILDRKLALSINGKLLSLALVEPQRPLMTKREFLVGCKVSKLLIQ